MRTGRPRTGKEITCVQCGKLVYRSPCQLGRVLCSHACRDAQKRAQRLNENDGTAKCAKCKTWKPIADFVKGVGGRPHSYCKPCSSEWFHDRRGTPPEKRKTYVSAYRLTPEEKAENRREWNHRQHQARRAAGDRPPKGSIDVMWCLQHGRCAYCQQYFGSKYHVDHKTPIARGGTNDIENLHLTCPRCNMRKGTMTHDEFLVSKRRPVVAWDDDD